MLAILLAWPQKSDAAEKSPTPRAHSSLIWGPTVCGFWMNQKVYIPCRYGYMKRRVRDYRNLLAGQPWRRDYRWLGMSLAGTGDYGPNSWYAKFNMAYNDPGPFHQAHKCRGTMIVNARTGKPIRVQNRHGRC